MNITLSSGFLCFMRTAPLDNFNDAPWHLALCRPNQGHIAFHNLAKAGFGAFMPRHRASWRWRGRQVDGWRPVFGSYLLFSTNPASPRWREVATMPGIGSLVKTGPHGPAHVPSAVICGLMLRCDAEGCLIPEADFSQGEAVRLTCGPFAGFVGTVDRVDPDRRIHLLLEIMGRATILTASQTDVERRL
jgi:transcriptional antiterminator RfaH